MSGEYSNSELWCSLAVHTMSELAPSLHTSLGRMLFTQSRRASSSLHPADVGSLVHVWLVRIANCDGMVCCVCLHRSVSCSRTHRCVPGVCRDLEGDSSVPAHTAQEKSKRKTVAKKWTLKERKRAVKSNRKAKSLSEHGVGLPRHSA